MGSLETHPPHHSSAVPLNVAGGERGLCLLLQAAYSPHSFCVSHTFSFILLESPYP